MAPITRRRDLEFDDPVLVEGLPGIGLVGKIATDHLIEELDMTYYAGVDCEGIPQVGIYQETDRTVYPPVRIYADEASDVLAIQSDVPVSRSGASEFAGCLSGFFDEINGLPLLLSGLPVEQNETDSDAPDVYGVATGAGGSHLDTHDIRAPPEDGVVGGPTGALLNSRAHAGGDAVGLVVESDARFPDPAAARQLLLEAIQPIADIDVDTEALVEHAEEIREQRGEMAQQMQQLGEEKSSQAQPLRMFQ